MPTYGYQCRDCAHQFSVFQSMKDDPVSVCPDCGGSVKRLLYPVGIVFKGSGWYINDSRKPEKSETGSTEGSSASKADAKTDSKADSADTKVSETKAETRSETAAPAVSAGK